MLILSCLGAVPFVSSQAAPVVVAPPFYPKNLASPLLGAKLRVDATTGFHLANGYPVPMTPSGTEDATPLLSEDFAGLELAPGTHSITIILPSPQVVSRVVFLNRTAEGSFTAIISGSDPQLTGPTDAKNETQLAGPDMVNSAVFQPQPARFIQVVFKISKRGNLGHLGVFGHASDLDYSLRQPEVPAPAPSSIPANTGAAAPPGFAPAPMATAPAEAPAAEVDVAALSSGARISRFSSSTVGGDPAWLIADGLDSLFFFNPADRAPCFDIDLHGVRRASRASLLLSGAASRIDLVRIPAPVARTLPAKAEGVVTHVAGTVEIVGLEVGYSLNVKPGTLLKSGQILRTSFDSSAEFEVNGTSLIRLGANSNALVALGAEGVEIHVLRGKVLWQVFDPAGGGVFVTPTTITELPLGTLIADVKLTGDTELHLLETGMPGEVQVRSRNTGERFTLAPGQDISLASGMAAKLTVEPFVAATYWSLDPIGAAAGGLHNDIDKHLDSVPPPPPEDILGTVDSGEGLTQVSIPFKEQTLDAVRFRITPLSAPAAGTSQAPPIIVKAALFGTYKRDELEVAGKEEMLPPVEAIPFLPSSAPTPAADQALPLPVPAPAPVPTAPAVPEVPVTPPPPQRVILKDQPAAPNSSIPAPASSPRAAPGAPAPTAAVPVASPAPANDAGAQVIKTVDDELAEEAAIIAKAEADQKTAAKAKAKTDDENKKTIFDRQSSKSQ